MIYRCSFKGCHKTAKIPRLEGWAYLANWGPGIPDGFYCGEHAAAIDAVESEISEIVAEFEDETRSRVLERKHGRVRRTIAE